MGYQAVFKRYEIKYLITREQKRVILDAMAPYMEPDSFGRSTVRNIYFDTDDYILARHSIAKPDFKEKLRIRSYRRADEDSTVFVELKTAHGQLSEVQKYQIRQFLQRHQQVCLVYGDYAAREFVRDMAGHVVSSMVYRHSESYVLDEDCVL